MGQFKLIAIRPLDGIADHIRKNLEKDRVYYFYEGYDLTKTDYSSMRPIDAVPDNFFQNDKNGIGISIHSIVGKNGSGKSAVVELLMKVINNLSYKFWGSISKDGVKPVFGVFAELYYEIDDKIFRLTVIEKERTEIETGSNSEYYKYTTDSHHNNKNMDIVFELQNIASKDGEIIEIEQDESLFKSLFYTIIVNYSQYAYNINDLHKEWVNCTEIPNEIYPLQSIFDKCWINGISHKNDGYATPIVINPMRTDGNIDINREKELTYNRFMYNLITQGSVKGVRSINRVYI